VDDVLLVTAVAIAMAVGLVGTVVPVIPGLALIWAAALVYGAVAGFGTVGFVAFTVISGLALAGMIVGFLLPKRAAAKGGASASSRWLGVVMAVVGFFVVPIVGVVLGGVVGVYLGEVLRTRDHRAAWRATVATLKGFGIAGAVQVAAGFVMVFAWVSWVVLG
jgi:uncharacterized protein YqgC (DUF456 family)